MGGQRRGRPKASSLARCGPGPRSSTIAGSIGAARRALILGSVVLTSACKGSDGLANPPAERSVADVVTPEVAQHVRNGQFELPAPAPGAVPEISRDQAEALAKGWLITLAPSVRGYLEHARGGPIDLAHLRPCGRTLYAESAYEPPAANVAGDPRLAPVTRPYGPFWLVTLCTPTGLAQVALAVSAYSTDLVLGPDGRLRAPGVFHQGGWFVWEGIPVDESKRFSITPEEAALRVADSTGARIAKLPRLVIPGPPREGIPLYARWRMALDRPVLVRPITRGAPPQQFAEVWVGADIPSGRIRFLAPDPLQPAIDSVAYPSNVGPTTRRGDKIEYAWYYARRRPEVPVRLMPVSVGASAQGE